MSVGEDCLEQGALRNRNTLYPEQVHTMSSAAADLEYAKWCTGCPECTPLREHICKGETQQALGGEWCECPCNTGEFLTYMSVRESWARTRAFRLFDNPPE